MIVRDRVLRILLQRVEKQLAIDVNVMLSRFDRGVSARRVGSRLSTVGSEPANMIKDVSSSSDDTTATISSPGHRARRDRIAERVSAASYGTVLVLAAIPLIDVDDVASGAGWGLVTGIGLATWIAHLYAEVVGDVLRRGAVANRAEITTAMLDGVPIPLAAVVPGLALLLGRLDVLAHETAWWLAASVAIIQLTGVGAYVGWIVSARRSTALSYALVTGLVGLVVVVVKFALTH